MNGIINCSGFHQSKESPPFRNKNRDCKGQRRLDSAMRFATSCWPRLNTRISHWPLPSSSKISGLSASIKPGLSRMPGEPESACAKGPGRVRSELAPGPPGGAPTAANALALGTSSLENLSAPFVVFGTDVQFILTKRANLYIETCFKNNHYDPPYW